MVPNSDSGISSSSIPRSMSDSTKGTGRRGRWTTARSWSTIEIIDSTQQSHDPNYKPDILRVVLARITCFEQTVDIYERQTTVGLPGILIIGYHNSSDYFDDLIPEFDQFPCLSQLTDAADTIWVTTGTFPYSYSLSQNEGDLLATLAATGRDIYLEGADRRRDRGAGRLEMERQGLL